MGGMFSSRRRRPAWPGNWPSAASSLCRWRCLSCARRAAAPSAARLSYADGLQTLPSSNVATSELRGAVAMTQTLPDLSALTREYSAHNYAPLPVVVAEAAGAWVTDVAGRRYLDMLAGYSALNFSHRQPRLLAATLPH